MKSFSNSVGQAMKITNFPQNFVMSRRSSRSRNSRKSLTRQIETLLSVQPEQADDNTSICLVPQESGYFVVTGCGFGAEYSDYRKENGKVWSLREKGQSWSLKLTEQFGETSFGAEQIIYWGDDDVVVVEEKRLLFRSIFGGSKVTFPIRNCRHIVRLNDDVFCSFTVDGKMCFGSFSHNNRKILLELPDIYVLDCTPIVSKKYDDCLYIALSRNPRKPLTDDFIIQLYDFRGKKFVRDYVNHTKSFLINTSMQYSGEKDLRRCLLLCLDSYLDRTGREILIAAGKGSEVFFYDANSARIIRKIHLGTLKRVVMSKRNRNKKKGFMTFVTNMLYHHNTLCVSRNNKELLLFHIPKSYEDPVELYRKFSDANINDWVLVENKKGTFIVAAITMSREIKVLSIPKKYIDGKERRREENEEEIGEIDIEEVFRKFDENGEDTSCKLC